FADLGGTGFKGIIAHNNSGESYNILFDAGISTSATDNRIGFYVKKTNGWSSVSSPAGSINDTTKWYYLTLTHSGGVLTGYVDGVSIGTITNANSIVKSSFSAIQFGLYGTSAGSEYLNGYIDEVKISNTARPLTWIKTEYNNQAKPSSFLYTSLENEY
ncbi:MAG: LamG domain-containing protein, partial [bacterium]|nr:LamG domain-containing protein [bacterium]